MINVKLSGLDKLQRELADATKAFQSLDGAIATLRFDPADPGSVDTAIRQMEAAIDAKTAPYSDNVLVTKVAEGLKEKYREMIREQAPEK